MTKDRSWMYNCPDKGKFVDGVFEFCDVAVAYENTKQSGGFYCPCFKCENDCRFESIVVIREHLLRFGFRPGYYVWVFHGETGVYQGNSESGNMHQNVENTIDTTNNEVFENDVDDYENEGDQVQNMVEDLEGYRAFEFISEASQKPLYPGCTKWTKLSCVLDLFSLKSESNWTDSSLLHLDLDGCESILKVGWMCPKEIYDQRCLKNKAEVKDYIETAIKKAMQSKRKFVFAPYLQDTHWVLLIVSPSTYTVYVLDSCRTEPPRSLMIMTWVNSVMKKVRTSTKIPNLISIKCAQQENGVECGYYVMRYMCDIIASCTKNGDLQTIMRTSKTIRDGPFTISEIDEVRDKLANFLTTYCS